MDTLFSPYWHWPFEAAAYFLGARLFLWQRKRVKSSEVSGEALAWLAVAAVLGAAFGSKLLFWLHDPAVALSDFPNLANLMMGKTVVGGFLGGLLAVEFTKKNLAISSATGDLFAAPMMLGLIIGRMGCFLAGLPDHTYGTITSLPWSVDFGDGLNRHPTQLYEVLFVGCLWLTIHLLRSRLPRQGDQFKLFLAAYLTFRFFAGFIKPSPHLYFGLLTGIQSACLAGLIFYLPHVIRILSQLKSIKPQPA